MPRPRRLVGWLLLAQLAGLIGPFVLLLPLGGDWPGALAGAAGAAPAVRAATAWLLLNGLVTVAVSLALAGHVRGRQPLLGLALVGAGLAVVLLQAVDNAQLLALLALARDGAAEGSAPAALESAARAVVAARRAAHLQAILAIDAWILLLHLFLRRTALVPRVLTAAGLAAVALHVVGIPLRSWLGLAPIAGLGMPMAATQLALAAWIAARGLAAVGREEEGAMDRMRSAARPLA